jgi:pyridoxamine 5'-phosphate oxidase
LTERPAGLLIYWPSVARQYRVAGPIVEMDRDEVEALYKMKSHESMLLSHYYAACHPQSHPIPSRDHFLAGIAALKARWPERDRVPVPEALAGIRMVPEEIETWHGVGESRLHDRRLYRRGPSGWTSRTLVP